MGNQNILIGNRIPRKYFITKGKGESNITIHAGSYHLALLDAGIERYNHLTYSSIMPKGAIEVEQPENYVHGSVIETITAVAHSEKGQRATAGIIIGWLYDKQTGEKQGGLVCEYNGNYSEDEVKEKLNLSLNELYADFKEKCELKDIKIITESFIPQKRHGTALVAIGFVDYIYPVVEE